MARGIQIYDSGVVASGAIIATPIFDTTPYERLLVVVSNSSGASTRALTALVHALDATTGAPFSLITIALATVGTSTTSALHVGPCSTTTNGDIPLPALLKFSLAAAGSSNGRLTIFGR